MKKIINLLRRPFRVQYRLSVLYNGDTDVRHTYGTDGKLMRRLARNTEKICNYWSLYKKGPFGLSEREVDFYMKGDTQ